MTTPQYDRGSAPHAGSVFGADLAERTGMTSLQVAVGWALVEAMDWPDGFAILIAAVLAVLKGLLAKHVGDRDSASLAPQVGTYNASKRYPGQQL